MIVCAYEYGDGICGITEPMHDRMGVARTGHTFTGAEVHRDADVAVDSEGVARFTRPLKAGQTYIVPIGILDAVMARPECKHEHKATEPSDPECCTDVKCLDCGDLVEAPNAPA